VTAPDIHIGRAIPLQRMRAFQDEGHVGVLIIGDYTTRIGDPSGRSAERPILTDAEIDANGKTYLEQAMVVLDPARTEVRYNGEWLSKLSYADVVRRRHQPAARAGRGDVRPDEADPRPAAGRLVAARGGGRSARRRADGAEARARAVDRRPLPRRGGRARGGGAFHAGRSARRG